MLWFVVVALIRERDTYAEGLAIYRQMNEHVAMTLYHKMV